MKIFSLLSSFGLLAIAHGQYGRSPAEDAGTVLGALVYQYECERTSLMDNNGQPSAHLNGAGATQCFNSGNTYFTRYISSTAALKIYGIPQIYNWDMVNAEAPLVELFAQSATAFMQGVYPPLDDSSLATGNVSAADNSTFIYAPLEGYQYPIINTYTPTDPMSVWVRGDANCPNQQASAATYLSTADYNFMLSSTSAFYQSLWEPYFQGVVDKESMYFFNATLIYDYMNQNRATNKTLQTLTDGQLQQLREYASHLEFNLYANTTTSTSSSWYVNPDTSLQVRDMGGRTLGTKLLGVFDEIIESGGGFNKFNMVMGHYDIMMSFFAIANLTSRSRNFYGLPNLGASMTFELYTTDTNITNGVDLSTLRVAFGFRNGSDGTNPMGYWPLFDQSNADGATGMAYSSFVEKMGAASVNSLADWCTICGNQFNFCSEGNIVITEPGSSASKSGHSGVSAPVAGVIGAVVTLAVLGLLAALAFFVFGVGFKRDHRRGSVRSSIGNLGRSGPKEKLSSDIELPLSPTSGGMARGFDDHYEDDDERNYDTISSKGTKVSSPLASPQEAHFKSWEARH